MGRKPHGGRKFFKGDKPKKRQVRQAPSHVQVLVKQRQSLFDLFQEKGWQGDNEKFALRALTSARPETRRSTVIHLPGYMRKDVLKIMARDPEKSVKVAAKKMLKELGEA